MRDRATGEVELILDELRRAYRGDAWHGPSLRTVLAGTTAEVASVRPVPDGHTIWEIVVHLSAWDDVVARRIAEGHAIERPDGSNFPPVTETSPDAWAGALQELDHQHQKLGETVARLDPTRCNETVAGKDYPVAVMLHGVAQHMAYHAGQIALIRKLAGSHVLNGP